MPRLSFVAYDAYPLLVDGVAEGIGGAEVRAVTFARGMAELGGDALEFIVHPRPAMRYASGRLQLRPYTRPRGVARTVSRFRASLSRRLTHLPPIDGFYRRLQTDVLLCFGVRNDTASMVRSAKAAGTRVIVFLTSDRNVDDAQRRPGDRGVYGERGDLCRYALQHADAVIAQTPYQRQALREHLQVESTLIRNPIVTGSEALTAPLRPEVLWVGRADTFSKRADVCLRLATELPRVNFCLVMNNHDPDTFRRLAESAPANARIVEQVPFDQVEMYFQQACLLVNTSAREGFPNSFLQAAKYGRPIVSLDVDPGGMLSQEGCGVCCNGDFEAMRRAVLDLVGGASAYHEYAAAAYGYVRRHHEAKDCCRQLKQIVDELVKREQRAA